MLHAPPKRVQSIQPGLDRIAGDHRAVDRADRRADHPVRLNAGLMQRLIDADLIGAERTAALEHEDDLSVLFLQRFCESVAHGRNREVRAPQRRSRVVHGNVSSGSYVFCFLSEPYRLAGSEAGFAAATPGNGRPSVPAKQAVSPSAKISGCPETERS